MYRIVIHGHCWKRRSRSQCKCWQWCNDWIDITQSWVPILGGEFRMHGGMHMHTGYWVQLQLTQVHIALVCMSSGGQTFWHTHATLLLRLVRKKIKNWLLDRLLWLCNLDGWHMIGIHGSTRHAHHKQLLCRRPTHSIQVVTASRWQTAFPVYPQHAVSFVTCF